MHRQINLFRSEFGAIHRFYFTPILAFPGYQLLIASGFFSSAGRISKGMQAAINCIGFFSHQPAGFRKVCRQLIITTISQSQQAPTRSIGRPARVGERRRQVVIVSQAPTKGKKLLATTTLLIHQFLQLLQAACQMRSKRLLLVRERSGMMVHLL
jgi:hypothetical protein